MAIKTLILGYSGTGKSASLRNFDPDEILIINCANKPLPFKNKFEIRDVNGNANDIIEIMNNAKEQVIVIDDCQYIMSFEYMRRIHENGWEKWNDIQSAFYDVIRECDDLPDYKTVYFLSHIETDANGREKIKTMGKMLDEKICIEGLFTTVLKTSVADDKYYFLTQNSGKDTIKSPIGMFESYAIENDLKYVDDKIRNFYGLAGAKSDEKIKEEDADVAAPEIEKPKRRRKKRDRDTVKKIEEDFEKAVNNE